MVYLFFYSVCVRAFWGSWHKLSKSHPPHTLVPHHPHIPNPAQHQCFGLNLWQAFAHGTNGWATLHDVFQTGAPQSTLQGPGRQPVLGGHERLGDVRHLVWRPQEGVCGGRHGRGCRAVGRGSHHGGRSNQRHGWSSARCLPQRFGPLLKKKQLWLSVACIQAWMVDTRVRGGGGRWE